MDFFINLGIVGISLILFGKQGLKVNEDSQKLSGFKMLDNIISYMESGLLAKINLKYGKKLFTKRKNCAIIILAVKAVWGISAAGSAQHWQCWGQEFESPMLHHQDKQSCCLSFLLLVIKYIGHGKTVP